MTLDEMKQAFPEVAPGMKPLGSRVLVQVRTPEARTKGGIILTENDRDTQMWNTSIAKVIDIGPLAFKNRNTLQSWPEGDWCGRGSYVRVPRYGGDRWVMPVENGDKAYFVLFNDLDVLGLVTTDPLQIKAFF